MTSVCTGSAITLAFLSNQPFGKTARLIEILVWSRLKLDKQ